MSDNKEIDDKITDNICSIIRTSVSDLNLSQFEDIYELFIYEVDVHQCVMNVLSTLITTSIISQENVSKVMFETQKFFRLYNNNYRPIYHVERYIYKLIAIINGV